MSSHSIVNLLHLPFPSGPHVFAFDENAGALMGVLFIVLNCGVEKDCMCNCHLMLYVVASKLAVCMRLNSCSSKTVRFSVNKGSAWEVPCGLMDAIANSPAMATQVVFCRSGRVKVAASGEKMEQDSIGQA